MVRMRFPSDEGVFCVPSRLVGLHSRYDQLLITALLCMSGGTKAANVCGFFGPNYTRRLGFGFPANCGPSEASLVMHGLFFPLNDCSFDSADSLLPPPHCESC